MDKIKLLILNHGGIILREGDDLDVFIDTPKLLNFLQILKQNGFIVRKNYNSTYQACIFLEKDIFVNIDIITNFDYIGYYFGLSFSIDANKYIVDIPYKTQVDVLRYVLLFRNSKKIHDFLKENIGIFPDAFQKFSHNKGVFKKTIVKEYKSFLSRNILKIYKYMGIKYTIRYSLQRLKELYFYILTGKLIVLEGPDGAGKTTIARTISDAFGWQSKYIYMGNKGGNIEKLFLKMQGSTAFYKVFLSLGVFCLFYCRYFKIVYYMFFGKIVIVDRWPVYEYGLLAFENPSVKPIFLVYKYLFPCHQVFIITADAKEVFSRKQELSISQIEQVYKHLAQVTGKKGVVIDNTGDISLALNTILHYLF